MAPKPPYNVDSLNPPFNSTQRTNIINFINAEVKVNPGLGAALRSGYGISHPLSSLAQLSDLGDGDLKNAYYEAVSFYEGGGPPGTGNPVSNAGNAAKQAVQNAPGISTVEDLIHKLGSGSFWVSAGEFLGGFILIAIGVHALVSDSIHPNSKHTLGSSLKQISKGPTGAFKVTKERTKATKYSGPRTSVSSGEASKSLKKIAEYGVK